MGGGNTKRDRGWWELIPSGNSLGIGCPQEDDIGEKVEEGTLGNGGFSHWGKAGLRNPGGG